VAFLRASVVVGRNVWRGQLSGWALLHSSARMAASAFSNYIYSYIVLPLKALINDALIDTPSAANVALFST
jgi:hypothetical protein